MRQSVTKGREAQRFREEVYLCCSCANLELGFTRSTPNTPFFKFPPTIGAKGEVPLLFVGIKPRISETNRWLHTALMANPKVFDELASNLYEGRKYIARDGLEPHYNNHVAIATAVFPGKSFEDVAAVTELFFCAKENSSGLPIINSPCANRYLRRTIRQVKPEVIVPVGKKVLDYFRATCGQTGDVFPVEVEGTQPVVVPMSHPSPRAPRIWTNKWTIERVAAAVGQ
jgi:uracil-DNA glycosylase